MMDKAYSIRQQQQKAFKEDEAALNADIDQAELSKVVDSPPGCKGERRAVWPWAKRLKHAWFVRWQGSAPESLNTIYGRAPSRAVFYSCLRLIHAPNCSSACPQDAHRLLTACLIIGEDFAFFLILS